MFKDEANAQAPGSDFTGTSLTVLKGVKELLTDKFLQVHHWLFEWCQTALN